MIPTSTPLLTPILIKQSEDWPKHEAFVWVTASGLYLCRNHPFFKSSVKCEQGPSELLEHADFFKPQYPVFPRRLLELLVGFFDRVDIKHPGAEAIALLCWDRTRKRYRLVIPRQTAVIGRSGHHCFPIGVRYDMSDVQLPDDWDIIGDAHSHSHLSAYTSDMDAKDEAWKTGIHLVIGKIDRDPPDFHAEAVCDGKRFGLKFETFFEKYERRRSKVPAEWIDKVKAEYRWYAKQKSAGFGS